MHVCESTLRPVSPIFECCISSQRSFPSRVRSPTPAKTETPPWALAIRAINSVRMTVLPSPAPPNNPALPPRTNGVKRSITLMPVSKISVFVDRSVDRRGVAVDGPVFLGLDGAESVDRLADQVEDAAEGRLADGDLHGGAGVEAVHAADHPVGVAQGDAPHPPAAEVLLHFAGEVQFDALFVGDDFHGVVDGRHVRLAELGVEGRADDLRDAADVLGRRLLAP